MVTWSYSGEVAARSSRGGFVMWWKGPCHWCSHTERFLHCCWAGAASQGIPMGFSQGMLSPWYSEPVSVFTPMAALISDYFPELLGCCNWWGAENFSFSSFQWWYFSFPDSWCGSGCIVQLNVIIRDCSFKWRIKSALSAHLFPHWISLCFSFALLRIRLWKMWSPSVSLVQRGQSFVPSPPVQAIPISTFQFLLSVFWEFWGRQAVYVNSASSCTSCLLLTALKGSAFFCSLDSWGYQYKWGK